MFSILSLQHYTKNNHYRSPCRYCCYQFDINWTVSKCRIQRSEDEAKNAYLPNGLAYQPFDGLPIRHRSKSGYLSST